MNVLMQLRKVCNHPDIFESRDYYTPSNQIFNIEYFVPHLIISEFIYNPMKSVNLKNLFLIFEEYEKYSHLEYQASLEYFPTIPFNKIYENIIKSEQTLFTNNYIHEEGNVYLRRQYADSTIFFPHNTGELTNSINLIFQNNNSSSKYNHMHSYPKFLCPTNIPLFQNLSLSNYFEIFNPTNINEEKLYLKSAFKENYEFRRKIKKEEKILIMHQYDIINRMGLILKKPIYGSDFNKYFKLRLMINDVNLKNIIYERNKKSIFSRNVVNSIKFNKFFKETQDKSFNNTITNSIFIIK